MIPSYHTAARPPAQGQPFHPSLFPRELYIIPAIQCTAPAYKKKEKRPAPPSLVRIYLTRWHATKCPGVISRSAGALWRQASHASGQRLENAQPFGLLIGLGTSPSMI